MIVEVKEAQHFWCPMVRMARIEPDRPERSAGTAPTRAVGGCNSGGPAARSPDSCRCIATACMMWRVIDVEKGYCGLAGKPF